MFMYFFGIMNSLLLISCFYWRSSIGKTKMIEAIKVSIVLLLEVLKYLRILSFQMYTNDLYTMCDPKLHEV